MPRKYTPRGPKCPVCKAVMSPKEEGGPPVCWFTDSHANILQAKSRTGQAMGEARRGRKVDNRKARAAAKAARKKKGKRDGT